MKNSDPPVRHIYRWDLDKTYLRTEFDTVRDLIRTALQKPEEKVNVPGVVALLRELTRPSEDGRALVTFISGSPRQMRASLEKKFELDGIVPDALILKPTLQNILRGRFRAIRGQVGYKLSTLLTLREQAPSAPEVLFGDDAEQDAFIYSLYGDLAAGQLGMDMLSEILFESGVYADTRADILNKAKNMRVDGNVRRIFIHLERALAPGRFWVFGPRLVPVVNYFQAALVLYADGVLDADALIRITFGMMKRYGYGLLDLANSFQDLARRGHLAMEGMAGLVEEVEQSPERGCLPEGFMDRLITRVQALAPLGEVPQRQWVGPPDYLEVLRADKRMRHSVTGSSDGLFG